MEHTKKAEVVIIKETNKVSVKETIVWLEGEYLASFLDRVNEKMEEAFLAYQKNPE